MAKSFSKKAEEQLLDAVRDVTARVENEGLDPTAAITKVAAERELPVTFVPLLTQAYNVGRCTYQREHGGPGVLNKVADFPIARVEDVMAQLYPAKPLSPVLAKQASDVSAEYGKPPTWAASRRMPSPLQEKVAAVKEKLQVRHTYDSEGDPKIKMAKAFGQAQRVKQAVEEARYQAGAAKDRFVESLSSLRSYFKQASYLRKPFDEVEFNAPLIVGADVIPLLDYVYTANGMKEARAEGLPKTAAVATLDMQPYSLIVDCRQKAAAMIAARESYAKLSQDGQEKVASIMRPFVQAPNATAARRQSVLGDMPSRSFAKEAGLMDAAIGGVIGSGAKDVFTPKTKSELVQDEVNNLNDPSHTDELRQIQARTMLSDFLANDEVISGFHPDEVTKAYNEISNLSRRAATQPAIMRPLLRKRLTAGSVEPFEAEQMANIEKTIRQTENPTPAETKIARVLHGYIFG